MLRFDHAIICVDDLQTAMKDFESVGFTVLPGGRHAAGTTHNALICFADGAYLELMALTGDAPQNDAADYTLVLQPGAGFVGCALAADDLEKSAAAMRARGLSVAEVETGGRQRPDGENLQWQIAFIGASFSPFLIADLTPRHLRVPNDPASTTHANGAQGIVGVQFLAGELEDAARRWHLITGVEGKSNGVTLKYPIEGCIPGVRAPEDDAERIYTETRPDAPYEIMLATSSESRLLTVAKTHHARLRLQSVS